MAAALITFIPIRATRTEYGISTLIWRIFSHVCPAGNSIPKRQRKPLCRKLVAAPAVFRTLMMHQLQKCNNFWHRLKQRLHKTPPDPLLCTLPRKALTCEAKKCDDHGDPVGTNVSGSSQVPKSPGCPAAPWPRLCVALSLPRLQRFLGQNPAGHPMKSHEMVLQCHPPMAEKQVATGQVQPKKEKSISAEHLIEARIEARTLGFIIQSHYQIEDIITYELV